MAETAKSNGAGVSHLLEQLSAELSAEQRITIAAMPLPSARSEGWRYSPLRALESKVRAWKASAGGLTTSDLSRSVLAEALQLAPNDLCKPGSSNEALLIPASARNSRERSVFSTAAALSFRSSHTLDKPQLWLCAPQAGTQLTQAAHQFYVPPDTNALLILEQQDGGAADSLSNFLYQIEVAKSAKLSVIHVQCAGASQHVIERSEITLAEGAELNYFELQTTLGWARHELSISLAGSGASAHVSSVCLLDARQHSDLQLSLWHESPNTRSSTRVKAIAQGRARSVFNGKIWVAPGADGTDAQLKTNNLLLSDTAEIDAKPELEIYAEEVSCSHGATVGQLDENALFYLQSRGIDPADARNMLIYAFAAELLSRVDCKAAIPQLDQIIQSRLSKQIGEATTA